MAKFKIFLLVFTLMLINLSLFSATITSNVSGNWYNGGTWVGGFVPGASDDVIINATSKVTLDGPVTCHNLKLNGLVGTRLECGAFTITVTNNIDGPATDYTNAIITTDGGKLRFTGASRQLFGINWCASHGNWACEVALNSGASGFAITDMKFGTLTITSGSFAVNNGKELRIEGATGSGSGSVYIANGATLTATGIMGTCTAVATTYCGDVDVYGNLVIQGDRLNGTVTVRNGGILTIKRASNALGLASNGPSAFNFTYATGSTLQYDRYLAIGRMPTGAEISQVNNIGLHYLSNMTINNAAGIDLRATPIIDGTLKIIDGDVITTNASTVIYGTEGILHYQGSTGTQTTTALCFPDVNPPASLFIENAANVNLHALRTIQGTLKILKGHLVSTYGATLRFGSLGYLEYNSTISQVTNDMEFPGTFGPAYLTIHNDAGVTLHASRTLSEDVYISGRMYFTAHTLTLSRHRLAITGTDYIADFFPYWDSTPHVVNWFWQSLPDIWRTQGTVSGTVDVTLYYDTSENHDPFITCWNRSVLLSDPSPWTHISDLPTNNLGLQHSVVLLGLTSVSSAGDNGMNWTLTPIVQTLPVEMTSFTGQLINNSYVSLSWVTQSESDLLGYLVYRSNEDILSSAVCISPTMIEATNSAQTHTYTFTDPEIETTPASYYYWIQHQEYSGNNVMHGPVRITVGDNSGQTPVIPTSTSIKSVYPNPFRENATISYGLSKGENVNLDIYNVKGQKVRSLVSSYQNANSYNVSWDGRDMNGRSCSAGIYYTRLDTSTYHLVKKIIYIK